jgi:hypothetical protein
MFATLGGRLPAPPGPDGSPLAGEDRARVVLELQAEAGLEPMTDAGTWAALEDPLEAWRRTSALTDAMVKAVVAGPGTLGAGDAEATMAAAETGNGLLRTLARQGCRFVEVQEPWAIRVGVDPTARELFVAAHRRLLDGLEGIHCSLAIVGGDAIATGAATLFAPPYQSYLFDLIAGPESWRLVVEAPGDRGIVCGVIPAEPLVAKEVAVWAAHYAASTRGRGRVRVGLATAGSLEGLTWEDAAARVRLLGEAGRIAALDSMEEVAAAVDPATFSGYGPPRRRR